MADVGALKGIKVGICGIKCSDLTKEAIKIIGVFFSCYKNLRLENNISEKWDRIPGTVSGTRDPRLRTHLIVGTRDPRPGTLNVGPRTRDPRSNS